jgi:hypothetical protein
VLHIHKVATQPLSCERSYMHPCVRTEACCSKDRRPAPYPPILSAALKRCSRPTARHSAPRVLRPPSAGSSRSGRASGAAKQRPAPPGAPSWARRIAIMSFHAAPANARPPWSLLVLATWRSWCGEDDSARPRPAARAGARSSAARQPPPGESACLRSRIAYTFSPTPASARSSSHHSC